MLQTADSVSAGFPRPTAVQGMQITRLCHGSCSRSDDCIVSSTARSGNLAAWRHEVVRVTQVPDLTEIPRPAQVRIRVPASLAQIRSQGPVRRQNSRLPRGHPELSVAQVGRVARNPPHR